MRIRTLAVFVALSVPLAADVHQVTVTRTQKYTYRVDGSSLFIETITCDVAAKKTRAIFDYTHGVGGTLTFIAAAIECDIATVTDRSADGTETTYRSDRRPAQ